MFWKIEIPAETVAAFGRLVGRLDPTAPVRGDVKRLQSGQIRLRVSGSIFYLTPHEGPPPRIEVEVGRGANRPPPLELHPKFLSKNGNNEFVILPFGEFSFLVEWVEDMEDLLDLRAAKVESAGEEPVGLEEVKKELELL